MKKNKSTYSQYNLSRKSSQDDEDDDDDFYRMMGKHLGYFEQTAVARKVTVYLDEEIREPSYYRATLNKINNLGQNDEPEIVVNTPGGRLDSAISIINAIKMTDANVVGIIDNQAISAGSLILLSCPNIFVAPNSTMMLHSYSTGLIGKSQEIMASVAFNDANIKKMMADVYFGFLNEKELGQLFNGSDLWMDSTEIVRRLEARNKVLQKLHKKAEQESKARSKVIPPPEYDPDDVALTGKPKASTGKEEPKRVQVNKVKKEPTLHVEETCIVCKKPAKWVRSTQFSGDHYYCAEHAQQEEDFGKSDSYAFWYEVN